MTWRAPPPRSAAVRLPPSLLRRGPPVVPGGARPRHAPDPEGDLVLQSRDGAGRPLHRPRRLRGSALRREPPRGRAAEDPLRRGEPAPEPGGPRARQLCVFDRVPRRLTLEQAGALAALARHVPALLELRRMLWEADPLAADPWAEVVGRVARYQPLSGMSGVAPAFRATRDGSCAGTAPRRGWAPPWRATRARAPCPARSRRGARSRSGGGAGLWSLPARATATATPRTRRP